MANNQLHHDIIAIRHILLNFDSWYKLRFFIVLIVLLSLLPVSLVSAQSASSASVAQVVTKPQRVIITLRSSVGFESRNISANQLSARRAQVRQTQTSFITRQKTRLRTIKRQMTVFPIIVADINTADIALLQKDSAVQNIQIDIAVPPIMYETNVTIGARTLQNAGYGGANTSVAVLDTGVKKAHLFLSGKVIYEYCSSTTVAGSSVTLCPDGTEESTALNSAEPCADSVSSGCMHGTHVAGIIAGNRLAVTNPWNNAAIAMAGVAPDAKLVAVQVFSKFTTAANCGTATTCVLSYSSDQLYALDYLYRNRASITPPLVAINMSLGGGKYNAFCDSNGLKSYIDQLRAVNIATIIASGNDGYTDGISGPACISSAIAVGASTTYKQMWSGSTQDQVASFSNAPSAANNVANSNGDRLLDVLAPGFKVLSSVPNSTTNSYEPAGYAYTSGTSMATPQVAGSWALLRSISPNASVSQIRDWLYNSGTNINDTRSGTRWRLPGSRSSQ